jgi:ElaB/YqjD/DUF883 family membrane-anchored ribosome-binding protein
LLNVNFGRIAMDGFTAGSASKPRNSSHSIEASNGTASDVDETLYAELLKEFEEVKSAFTEILEKRADQAREVVKHDPWPAVLIAAGVGAVIGLAVSRRKAIVPTPVATQFLPKAYLENVGPSFSERLTKMVENISSIDKSALSNLPTLGAVTDFLKNMIPK